MHTNEKQSAETARLIGQVVEDTSVDFRPRYAVGVMGFLCLTSGAWWPYDSAFDGPDFFRNPAFVVVTLPPGKES